MSGPPPRATDRVAMILAVGVSVALIAFVVGLEVNSVNHPEAVSENTTQVLTAAFMGIIGGLAGYMGGRWRGPDGQ